MSGIDDYRSMLAYVADEITNKEAKDLAQNLDISRADRSNITCGRELIQEMEKIKFVSKDNVDNLLEVLKDKKIAEAAGRVEDYKKDQNGGNMSTRGKMNKTKCFE